MHDMHQNIIIEGVKHCKKGKKSCPKATKKEYAMMKIAVLLIAASLAALRRRFAWCNYRAAQHNSLKPLAVRELFSRASRTAAKQAEIVPWAGVKCRGYLHDP